jgi:hypothetical protein
MRPSGTPSGHRLTLATALTSGAVADATNGDAAEAEVAARTLVAVEVAAATAVAAVVAAAGTTVGP